MVSDSRLPLQIPLGITVAVGVVALNVWLYRRAVRSLERRAAENHLRFLERLFGWFLTGSFPGVVNRGTYSFKVTVEDPAGIVRRAWVHVSGLTQSKVVPKWDAMTEPTTAFPVTPTPALGADSTTATTTTP